MARNSHVVQALGVEDQLGCLACCSGNLLPRIKDPHDSAFISFGRIMAPIHEAVSPLAVFDVVRSLRQVPLAVGVDVRHVLQVLVCKV